MRDYLEFFPKPFLDDIVNNKCIPFIGAGFSKNASLGNGMSMPLWEELAKELANMIPDYHYGGAQDAISAFEHEFSRVKLVEELNRMLFINSSQPGTCHTSFCRLSFDLVCTTNFDFLLERGYEAVGRYCRPVMEEDQLSVSIKGPSVTLLKFHGDVNHPTRMVLTEDDYSLFISQYPLVATFIANLLISKTAWFIGYSLDDPDFRQLWQIVGDRLGKLRRLAYTIKVSAPPHEVARFERRGVRVINLPGSKTDYASILETVFTQLHEYWSNHTAESTVDTEEDIFAELLLTKDAKSRICFFIVPKDVEVFYRRYVFPIAEKYGFRPLTVFEVVSPGDSVAAKISSIIERAQYIVLDVSTRTTMMEASMVFAQRSNSEHLLVIKDPDADLPLEWLSRMYLVRPNNLSDELDNFLGRIEEWFVNEATKNQPLWDQEPKRLLEANEYRSAVISAISLLEYWLRKELSYRTDNIMANQPLTVLLKNAVNNQLISSRELSSLREWIRVRNEAIHNQAYVKASMAKRIVSGILEIINRSNRSIQELK